MIGELIGAAGSIISGLLGSSAEKKAAKENKEIAMANLAWDKEKFERVWALAEKQEAEGKLGQTDADGNVYHFVEGVGWRVDLSDVGKLIKARHDVEQKTREVQDIPLRREQMFANAGRQYEEGRIADDLRNQFTQVQRRNPQDVTDQRNLLTAEAFQKASRGSAENATRQAMSMGNNAGAANALRELGVGQMDALRTAFLQNQQGARQEAQSEYDTGRTNRGNEYNMFATRASALAPADTQLPNTSAQNAATLQAAIAGGQAANQMNQTAASQQAPNLKYQAPVQYGLANTVGTAANQLGQINFDNIFGSSSNNNNSSMFPSAPNDPNKYKGSTGLY